MSLQDYGLFDDKAKVKYQRLLREKERALREQERRLEARRSKIPWKACAILMGLSAFVLFASMPVAYTLGKAAVSLSIPKKILTFKE